jgi:repressor LexA
MSEQDINKFIAQRISYFMAENKKNQQDLADYMGVSQATISNWCNGVKMPRMDKIDKLCKFFGINRSDLMDEKNAVLRKTTQDNVSNLTALQGQNKEAIVGTIQIPVLGEVAAGIPIFAQENYIDYECITEQQAANGRYFGLKIKGDSMSPRISEGDTVIVRQQDDAESGDIVIVLINGDNATCKRLMKYSEGISLISFNPLYEPMTFSNEDILSKPVKIIGKVVENRQKY